MSYRYEIFLSYPRIPMVTRWLDRFFEPLFAQWLHQELLARQHELPGGGLRIFRDQTAIGAGQQWLRELREAARDSRCALAILLPSYFKSEYCLKEWETFRRRGAEFQRDVLVPVRFHDCLPLQEQAFDLSKFTAMVEDTTRWVEFHDQVTLLASQVAERVLAAPPYPANPADRDRPPWLAFDPP